MCNKVVKEGVIIVWIIWDEFDVGVVFVFVVLSEEWVSEKVFLEMGFILGGIEEMKVVGMWFFLVIGDDGMIYGMISWMLVCCDG